MDQLSLFRIIKRQTSYWIIESRTLTVKLILTGNANKNFFFKKADNQNENTNHGSAFPIWHHHNEGKLANHRHQKTDRKINLQEKRTKKLFPNWQSEEWISSLFLVSSHEKKPTNHGQHRTNRKAISIRNRNRNKLHKVDRHPEELIKDELSSSDNVTKTNGNQQIWHWETNWQIDTNKKTCNQKSKLEIWKLVPKKPWNRCPYLVATHQKT